MAEAAVTYRPLKEYVAKAGGVRLAMHPRLRAQLVDIAVEEYPFDAADETAVEVLTARMTIRARRRYGKILVLVFVTNAAAAVAKLVHGWMRRRHAHKVLMLGWQETAKRAADDHSTRGQ